jgi:hypothetical protein
MSKINNKQRKRYFGEMEVIVTLESEMDYEQFNSMFSEDLEVITMTVRTVDGQEKYVEALHVNKAEWKRPEGEE